MEKHSIRKITSHIRAHPRILERRHLAGKLVIGDSFILLLSALLFADDEGVLFLLLIAAGLHEAGHYLALRACGGKLTRLTLTAAGAVMRYRMKDGRVRRCLVAAAGPCVSLLVGIWAARGQCLTFAGANIALGVFNLLPIVPLDGGMMLIWLAGQSGRRIVQFLSVLCAAALVPVGILWAKHEGGIWLLCIGIGLLMQQKTCIGGLNGIY